MVSSSSTSASSYRRREIEPAARVPSRAALLSNPALKEGMMRSPLRDGVESMKLPFGRDVSSFGG
jgi:hypothetical protein